MFCAHCGKSIYYNGYGGRRPARLECRNKPPHFKSARYDYIEKDVLLALEQSELPNLEAVVKNNAGKNVSTQRMALKRMEDEMQGYREQEEMQYELLETRQYSREVFEKRNAALRQRMSECEEKIKKISRSIPDAINYEEKIVSLQSAIKALKDGTLSPAEKNKQLKVIIDKI